MNKKITIRHLTTKTKRQRCRQCLGILITGVLLTGCAVSGLQETAGLGRDSLNRPGSLAESPAPDNIPSEQPHEIRYEVDPETFSLTMYEGKTAIQAARPGETRRVEKLVRDGNATAWEYPDSQIAVSVKPQQDYLSVTVTSLAESDNEFLWPRISGDTYYMPFGEGKRIPSGDKVWNRHLRGTEYEVLEQLSMPFWATVTGDCAVLFIMEDPIRNRMVFSEEDTTAFHLVRQYPEIDEEKENRFRIYLTGSSPVLAAKQYREYVKEQGNFVTLEQKAEQNPNIRKLYGAPHIYLWGENLISPEDINWPEFRKALGRDRFDFLLRFVPQSETGEEAGTVMEEIKNQDYVADYQKLAICRFLTEVLKMPSFLGNETDGLDEAARIEKNKQALAGHMPEVFGSADHWMDGGTIDIIDGLKEAGIDRAWIGLNSWEQAYGKPPLAKYAVENGYLIGPYDSYHSIHEPGEERWITAAFPDDSLYENATVTGKDGQKEAGFKNVGRKLNPALSLPYVKQRVEEILKNGGTDFNSWFIDCDATGEIYDDYSPSHVTTKEEDLQARLARMSYIRDQHQMVIGSEGGNDFAAKDIAFAHGIELKSFSWMDEDMKQNRESEYYIGKYYNPSGGVAEHFAKQIPVKDEYVTIFVNPEYDVPLYKLVYNDSVITTYHWDWSTFKIEDAVKDRMVRELLYNVPPLYHLDSREWEKYREDITVHTGVWSEFSRKAILREMTDFQYLTEDGAVQICEYGDDLAVIANFGEDGFLYEGQEIPPHAALLMMEGNYTVYIP